MNSVTKESGSGIATGDFDRRDDLLGRNDIIVATSEKVDSLLRNNARWIADITLLVIDEVHLIDSPVTAVRHLRWLSQRCGSGILRCR